MCHNAHFHDLPQKNHKQNERPKEDIVEEFSDERLLLLQENPWLADMANFKAAGIIPERFTWQQIKKFLKDYS